MAKKLQVQILPKLDIRPIGDFLFWEALRYGQLEVVAVGKHTCYVIHSDPKGKKKPWVSFHYRRNLKLLCEIGSLLGKGEAFLKALEIDLHLLAKALIEDPLLKDIRMLVGLSGLSALWGRRHGFTTALYTADEKLIRRHNDSIADNPNRGKGRLTPLHLFFIKPRGFIREFHKERASCA
jgi:hypothetical protein